MHFYLINLQTLATSYDYQYNQQLITYANYTINTVQSVFYTDDGN